MNSTIKFGQSYHMEVQGQTQPHEIDYPLTCGFSITRTQFASLNAARFSIYGLNALKQKDIYFDRNILQSFSDVHIKFFAGYTSQNPGAGAIKPPLPIIFTGSVHEAYTERSGGEIITQLGAFDGGFAGINSYADGVVWTPKTTYADAMLNVMETMRADGVTPGQVNVKSAIPQPLPFTDFGVFTGNSLEVLRKNLPRGATCFIDNCTVHILGQNDTLIAPTALPVLSSSTGLLDIPKRQFYTVTCSMIFEPRIVIGQLLRLHSTLAPWVNNDIYKVTAFTHAGTISAVESGKVITELTLQSTSAVLR
jgi:hypothetical protein